MIRVLIADNEKLLRVSLKNIIEIDPGIRVAGLAGNGEEAFRLCMEQVPDVVLMDINMPVCDGIEGTKLIKQKNRDIKVVMLTTSEDEDYISGAVKNGADGYILKDVTPDELINVIKNAAGGFLVFSGKTGDIILKRRNSCESKDSTASEALRDKIVPMKEIELKILQLIAEGKSNRAIAGEIFLSEGRVKNIVSEMLAKLELKDRYQLLSFAYRNNMVK